MAPVRPTIRVRRHRLGNNTGVGHYQPRHASHEVVPSGPNRRRRPLVVGAAVAGTVIVAAAIAVPLMAGGGGRGGGSTTTGQAASSPTTRRSAAPVATTVTPAASTGPTNHVSTRGAGSPDSTTTDSTRDVTTTTTRPHVNPAAGKAPAVNVAAPNGFGQLIQTLWVGAHPGGVTMNVADVASVLPGSVFYSEQPAIGTFWAIARFVPSAQAQSRSGTAAGNALLAQFSSTAMFVKVPGQTWHYLGAFTTTACGQGVPAPVLASWGMCGP
jgi:hypothetical protein